MDPQVLQAAERVLAWCRAQVWDSTMALDAEATEAAGAESEWPASTTDDEGGPPIVTS